MEQVGIYEVDLQVYSVCTMFWNYLDELYTHSAHFMSSDSCFSSGSLSPGVSLTSFGPADP